MDIYRDMPSHVLMGLAAQTAAENLGSIEHINLTPDMIGPALSKLAAAGAAALGAESD
jgi:hypothetical protein